MDRFLELLKSLGIDVTANDIKTKLDTADFKAKLEVAFPKVDGLLTQEQFDKGVQERLKRQEKVHEQELTALREDMKKLVDPTKISEVENQFKGQLEAAQKKGEALTKEMKLRESLYKAGVKDVDYLMYQAGQKGLADRFAVDEKGNISVVGADGKPAFGKDGKALEFGSLIEEMKTDFGSYFGEQQQRPTPGATNPFGGGESDKSFGQQLAEMNNGTGKTAVESQSIYFGGGKTQ
jgi:Skp family chaperone for outer membrane proteins